VSGELQHYFNINQRTIEYDDVQKIFELHGVSISHRKSWGKIRELKFLVNTTNMLTALRPIFEVVYNLEELEVFGPTLVAFESSFFLTFNSLLRTK
jgi:hypothetical protein